MDEIQDFIDLYQPVLVTEILSNIQKGIYTITYFYKDGRIEIKEVPKGLICRPIGIYE